MNGENKINILINLIEDNKPDHNWIYISPAQLEGSHNHNKSRNQGKELVQKWLCEIYDICGRIDGFGTRFYAESHQNIRLWQYDYLNPRVLKVVHYGIWKVQCEVGQSYPSDVDSFRVGKT